MHQQGKQEALCIGDHVSLASLDTLAGVKSARTATFCGFDALAIDDTSRRNSVTAHRQPSAPHQRKIDPRPDALIPPKIEVVLNGGIRRKVFWQQSPLASGHQDVEDRIHHHPHITFTRESGAAWRWPGKRTTTAIPPASYRLHNAARRADIARG